MSALWTEDDAKRLLVDGYNVEAVKRRTGVDAQRLRGWVGQDGYLKRDGRREGR